MTVRSRFAKTSADGSASLRMRINRKGRYTVTASKPGFEDGTATLRVKR